MKKVMLIFIVAVFVITLPILLMYLIYKPPNYYHEGQANKRIMIEHIERNYGSDYVITDEYLGKSGWDGRYTDVLTVSQHEIVYEVIVPWGNVEHIHDTYQARMSGKSLIGELIATVGKPPTDYNITAVVTENISIRVELFNIQNESLRDTVWLYDFYKEVASYDFAVLSLVMVIKESGKVENLKHDSSTVPYLHMLPCYFFSESYWSDDSDKKSFKLTQEEFFDKFEYFS